MKEIFLSKSKLAIMLVLLLMLGGLNHAFAFRAPDIQDEMKPFKSADANSLFSKQSIRLESKPMLKSILHRNLNKPVKVDAVQAAKDIVQNLMSTGFVGFIEGQQSFNGEQQSLTRDGSGIANNLQTTGIKAQLRKTQVDNLGYQHIRIAQTFHDLPVVGAEIIVHINNRDIIYQMNGKYLPDIKVSVEPSIDASAALKVGLDEQEGKPGVNVSKEPSLVIYGTHLAYHYVISHEGTDVGQWWYYVDAHTGKLIYRYNNIQYAAPVEGNGYHTNVSGNRLTGEDGSIVVMQGFYENAGSLNYFLYNFSALWGIYDEDAFDWEQQASSNWSTSDPAAVSGGKNYADTQTYVSNVLGRNSFDDAGAFARANVHTGDNYVNAYWDGTDFHFGDGDGVIANALTVLDIAAHEYGHALTSHTSNLIYSYESGSLNEAYSDIIGCSVEFYTQPDGTGSYPNATPGHDDWLMGEDCWLSDVALRDISDPQRYELPSYYHGTYWYTGTDDNGGVHTNNGPACFAYYLLAVGGSGTNDGHPYGPITGVGEVDAAAVALRANYYYHVPSDQYADAREHWISAASDLGFSTTTVEDVWTACGVDAPCPTVPGGDFEGGVIPPTDWTHVQNNVTETWQIDSDGPYEGTYAAMCLYDPNLVGQDEWLVTPYITDPTKVSFYSFGNCYWCRDTYDNCDLEVWLIVGSGVNDGDDVYLGKADDDWPFSFVYAKSTFSVSAPAGTPVRIGFRYVGNDGAQIDFDLVKVCTTTVTKDELAVDFKTLGIYVYNAGIWNKIYQGVDPDRLCSFGTNLAVDFGTTYGLYVYDAGVWTRVYKGVAIEKMAGFGDKLAVDFGTSYPMYEYDFAADTWSPIYTYSSPRDTIEALGDKLVVDFKAAGIYVYDAGSWNRIYKGIDPVNIVSFGDKLAIDFGITYGLYVYEYDTDNWTRIYKGVEIEKMAEIDGDLVVDFGTAHGLYVYEFDADNWTRVYKGVAIEKMAGFDGNLAVDFGTSYPIYEYDFGTDNWNSIYNYSSPRDELVPANILD